MGWLNYHHLMYFRAIATEGSISKASKKLLVGQPALSAQLKQLEEFFGHKLFDRKNRSLELTDAGRAALKYASQIYSLGTELKEVLNDKSFAVRPHITIGAQDSTPKALLKKLIKETAKMNNCHITVIEANGDELCLMLAAHSIDLAITNHHISPLQNKTFFETSIGKKEIHIYGAERFKGLRKNFPFSLNAQPIVLPTAHSKLRTDIEHYLELNNISCNVVADTQDTALQKLLAVDGLGVIAEPEFAVRSYVKEKKIFKLGTLKGVFEEFFFTSSKRVIKNPIVADIKSKFKI